VLALTLAILPRAKAIFIAAICAMKAPGFESDRKARRGSREIAAHSALHRMTLRHLARVYS
jgi:hypothetical protein